MLVNGNLFFPHPCFSITTRFIHILCIHIFLCALSSIACGLYDVANYMVLMCEYSDKQTEEKAHNTSKEIWSWNNSPTKSYNRINGCCRGATVRDGQASQNRLHFSQKALGGRGGVAHHPPSLMIKNHCTLSFISCFITGNSSTASLWWRKQPLRAAVCCHKSAFPTPPCTVYTNEWKREKIKKEISHGTCMTQKCVLN